MAAARSGSPGLIDRALNGEEVVISRRGKPIAELRPIAAAPNKAAPTTYAWLKARRQARNGVRITSVELLRQVYAEPEA